VPDITNEPRTGLPPLRGSLDISFAKAVRDANRFGQGDPPRTHNRGEGVFVRTATLEQPLDRRKSQTFPPSEKTTTTREPFAALPHSIAGRPDITPTEKAVLLALLFWAKAKAICWPSDASIGARIGRSVGTVQRALRRLEALGLIVRQKTADNPTGRLIVLVWVAERLRATPPSPALEPPAPPARDEGRNGERRKTAGGGCGPGSPPLPAGEATEEPDRATLHQWAEGATRSCAGSRGRGWPSWTSWPRRSRARPRTY
jgi:DNA-binding MarR family transcriptional regulator